jgi:3D (Asp-Asp-Asp) domain-containing protein
MRLVAGALLAIFCFLLQGDSARLAVTVTAYSSGTITASGSRVRLGDIALSRDVERDLHVRFGDKITLDTRGMFTFTDRMPWYWHRRVDLYLGDRQRALQFGKQQGVIQRLVSPLRAPSTPAPQGARVLPPD